MLHHFEKCIVNTHFPHSGGTFTSARLIYAAGRERYLPAMFGRLHKTRKTPLNALLLHAALTIMYILIGGGFRSLINFSVVASWAFYFLTVSFWAWACLDWSLILGSGVGPHHSAVQGARAWTTIQDMDNNASHILRGSYSFQSHTVTSLILIAEQVALFLLCMPIIAAPLPALAVLGKCYYVTTSGKLTRNSFQALYWLVYHFII